MKKDKNLTRKKFVFGFGILAAWAATKLNPNPKKVIIACAPPLQKKTVKMLTEDGRLVEIESPHQSIERKKITDDELKSWVKK